MRKVSISNIELGNTGEVSKDKINSNFNELNAALSELDDESLRLSAVSHQLGFSTAKVPSEYAVSKEMSKKANTVDVAVGMINKGSVNTVSNLPSTALRGDAYYVTSAGYIYQYDGYDWYKTAFTTFPGDVAIKGGTEKTLKELEDETKFMPVLSALKYDRIIGAETYGDQQVRRTSGNKLEFYAGKGVTPEGGHIGIRNQVYQANTSYTFRAIFKVTGFSDISSEVKPYVIYVVNGTRTVTTPEVTELGNNYLLYHYELEAQPSSVTLSLFGAQAVNSTAATIAAENSIVCQQVQVYASEPKEVPALENELTEKLTAYLGTQFTEQLDEVALKGGTDKTLKEVEDEINFMPVLTDKEYEEVVGVQTYEAQQVRRTREGRFELYAAPGDTPHNGHIGIRYQDYQAHSPYIFRLLFKITGFTNPLSEISRNFIYTVNGVQTVKTARVTVLSDEYYLYEYNLEAQDDDFRVVFFGAQAGTPSAATIAAANSITCEQVQVYRKNSRQENILENQLTGNICSYLNKLDYLQTLRLSSETWRNELYGSAMARPANNGFTVPAGETFNPSFTAVRFTIPRKEKDTFFEIYFRMPQRISGTSFFVLRYDKTAPNGSHYVVNQVPVMVEGDLWKLSFTIAGSETCTGVVDMAIQQGNGTSENDFYVYWEKAYYWQDYNYGNDRTESFGQYAVRQIAAGQMANPVTEIIVSADVQDKDAAFTGNNAIQLALNSITDASRVNRYRIFVKKGVYKVTNSSQFLGYPGYPAMILMKDYVDIVGESMDECIIWAELPYEDSDIDSSIARNMHQTVWNYAKEATMENLTLVAKNLRYVIHQDSGSAAHSARYYKNVKLEFIGDKGSRNAFGLGVQQGEENYVEGGMAVSSVAYPFACHNNSNFTKRALWSFKDFQFVAYNTPIGIQLQNCGSKVNDELRLEGCSFGGRAYMISYANLQLTNKPGYDYFNHADFRITGYGNAPFLFSNGASGEVLKITSNKTGKGSRVRFPAGSSGFELLISEPRLSQGDVFACGRQLTDGYMYQDGNPGLSGYALGCKDISQAAAQYDNGIVYTSLGKRLGDCFTENKALDIEIDNERTYRVVFNKNYTNMDNASILAEINAVIGDVATASVHSYGREYYPMMPDVTEIALNGLTDTYIPKGTVVKKQSGRIYPCDDQDNTYGVALEDIPAFENNQGVITGQGRILKRGYIQTVSTTAFFVISDSDNAVAAGNRFRVEDGRLIKDATGSIRAIDANVVAINC